METFQYTITDGIGIHARPAGELAKLAKKFRSQITIKTKTKQADAEKSRDKADEKKAQRTVPAQTKHKQQDMEL